MAALGAVPAIILRNIQLSVAIVFTPDITKSSDLLFLELLSSEGGQELKGRRTVVDILAEELQ